MLKRRFDTSLMYRVVLYLRMSSDQQNKRSPKQQQTEIEKRLKALGYKWKTVKVYQDDAKTGRLLRNRRNYNRMLRELKSGTVCADLILVDTLERFGRVEELPTIRKRLFEEDGVLVLTADTNFEDPNSPAGKALGMVESMRATEHGRILGHNVLRGKRDTAQQKHWPGGPPPFGMMLKSIMKIEKGREVVDYSILVPDPKTFWIIVTLFNKAAETGWGTTRLARFLNAHPDIPDSLKPFQPETIGYWLDNEIYYGELVWEKNSTGIMNDMRVVEPNAEEDMLRVPDYCDALVTKELWMNVQALRQIRRQRQAEARGRKAASSEKQLVPPAPGMTLNYLLSGLIVCGKCRSSMTASSSAEYTTKAGVTKRYVSYVCPGYMAVLLHRKFVGSFRQKPALNFSDNSSFRDAWERKNGNDDRLQTRTHLRFRCQRGLQAHRAMGGRARSTTQRGVPRRANAAGPRASRRRSQVPGLVLGDSRPTAPHMANRAASVAGARNAVCGRPGSGESKPRRV